MLPQRLTTPRNASTRPLGLFWTAVVSVVCFLAGCQKQNIKVKGHDLGTILAADKHNPMGIPTELAGALGAAKTYVQTRGVITLQIDSTKISPSSPLELINETTGLSLIKAAAGAFGLNDQSEDKAWSLTDSGYEFTLTIYPLDPNFVGKFAYGANKLTLNVEDDKAAKDAKQQITMQDFPYFAPSGANFGSNEEQQDGFQGEVSPIAGTYVSNGDYELSTGFVAVIHR